MSLHPSTEELFTSPDYFDVTKATPVQRALCRIIDGRPLGGLETHPEVLGAFSSWVHPGPVDFKCLEGHIPSELDIAAGTRGGKTRFSGAVATRSLLTCDTSDLKPGEWPRVPIVSVSRDLARAAFQQISDTFMAKPKLRALLLDEPNAGSIKIRLPCGQHGEIVVVAGRRAGASLVARWLPCAIFDEAPRMLGSEDGQVVNLDHMLEAIISRMRGPILMLGSPWAPQGPVYSRVQTSHGKPSPEVVVCRAKGWWMNPSWWTKARRAQMQASKDVRVKMALRTDGEAEFTDPEENLIASVELDRATYASESDPPNPRVHYVATMDPATRGNAWTLVVRCQIGDRKRIALACEWVGSKAEPLDPGIVFTEAAATLKPYGVTKVYSDQWSFDALRRQAKDAGLTLLEHEWRGELRTKIYLDMANAFAASIVDIPSSPMLRTDLLGVRKIPSGLGIVIKLPKTTNGRHCDYAPSVALALAVHCPTTPEVRIGPLPRDEEARREESQLLAAAKSRYVPRRKKAWWKDGVGSL